MMAAHHTGSHKEVNLVPFAARCHPIARKASSESVVSSACSRNLRPRQQQKLHKTATGRRSDAAKATLTRSQEKRLIPIGCKW
jgi:hypothetical protein